MICVLNKEMNRADARKNIPVSKDVMIQDRNHLYLGFVKPKIVTSFVK